jgi:3-deoxy-7-phosphoheptulonate synthase
MSFTSKNQLNGSSFTISGAGINILDDQRVKCYRPLLPPQILMEEFPLTLRALNTVVEGRRGAEAILNGESDKLLVVSFLNGR